MKKQFLAFIFPLALLLLPQLAFAATLTLSPSSVSVTAGETFVEQVFANSADEAANAVSGELSFPTDLMSVVSVSKANSILTLWVQDPTFSNSDGTVDFSGVVPNPGFTGSGEIFSVTFLAKKTGQGSITFSSSEVLANDGSGTDILTGTNSSPVAVAKSPVVPPTPPPSQTPTPVKTPAPTNTPVPVVAPAQPIPLTLSHSTSTATSTSLGVVVPWFVLNLPTLLLAFALVLMLLWVLYLLRHHSPKAAGRRHGAHTHTLVHQEFGGLRAAVASEILKLEHTHTKRELNKQEELFMDRMEHMLQAAEEKIEKEIDL